jgi:hypothetical protein
MTEEDAPAAARKEPSTERHWGNIAAGFSAACALAVSAYTAFLQRQQVKAQVWPLLSWGIAASTGSAHEDGGAGDDAADAADAEARRPSFKFELKNDGVGPAIVRAMEVTFDGKPIRRWVELLIGPTSLLPDHTDFDAHVSMTHSRVIAAGEEIAPFEPYGEEQARAMYAGFARVHVTLCYCSVLDDCWELQAEGFKDEPEPQPVRTCFKPRVSFEQ